MGDLIPVYWEACVPTDKIRVAQEALARLMPMVAPMMHEVNLTFHTFFVPYRILWDEKTFEKWITNQKELGVLPAFPTFNIADPSLSEPGVPVTKDLYSITSIFLLLHLQIVPQQQYRQ